jgi:hypothetical protein
VWGRGRGGKELQISSFLFFFFFLSVRALFLSLWDFPSSLYLLPSTPHGLQAQSFLRKKEEINQVKKKREG